MTSTHTKAKRRGDPRMNRALDAREADPKLSLVDALMAGGFIFPEIESEKNAKKLFDTEGVTLYQRKNQLLRRIRISKQKDPTIPTTESEEILASSFNSSQMRSSKTLGSCSLELKPSERKEKHAERIQFYGAALEGMAFEDVIYPDDERRELCSLSGREKAEIVNDVHGTVENLTTYATSMDDHLRGFDNALSEIDSSKKQALFQAQRKCPELVSKKEKIMFLRWANFDVKQAAARLTSYWDMRIQIFGDDAFLPLTLDRIRERDKSAFPAQIYTLLPQRDDFGRALLWLDPSHRNLSIHTAESEARCLWCLLHNELEDETIQEKGFVMLFYVQNADISKQFDRKVQKIIWGSLRKWMPVKIRAIHIIRPPPFASVLSPIIKFFMGRILRLRLRLHAGTNEIILASLFSFGIPESALPTEIGGLINLDTCNR